MTIPIRGLAGAALALASTVAPARAGVLTDYVSPVDDAQFTAFDLASNAIVTRKLPAGTTAPGAHTRALCPDSALKDATLTVKRTTPESCVAIFDAAQPMELWLDAAGASAVALSVPLGFDRGVPGVLSAVLEVEGGDQRLNLQNDALAGGLVYHSTSARRWVFAQLTKGKAPLADKHDRVTEGTRVYVRVDAVAGKPMRRDGDLFEVTVTAAPPPPKPQPPAETDCADELRRAKEHDWSIFVSSRGKKGGFDIVRYLAPLDPDAANPFQLAGSLSETGGTVIEPNTYGLIVVRHDATQFITINSPVPKLTLGAIFQGPTQSGTDAGAGATSRAGGAAEPARICSTHQVGPLAPGGHQLKIGLVEASDPSKVVVDRALDVVVTQRYIGAFRAGVAAVFLQPDRTFEARTVPGSTTAEIKQVKTTPAELVLGYSVYLSSLYGNGRSYFRRDGEARQDNYVGLFLGFGAASFAAQNFDYLKSLHLGVEVELGPHVALAVTGALRRVDQLADGVKLDGPIAANGTVPVNSEYKLGLAVVLNISPSFFKLKVSQ